MGRSVTLEMGDAFDEGVQGKYLFQSPGTGSLHDPITL